MQTNLYKSNTIKQNNIKTTKAILHKQKQKRTKLIQNTIKQPTNQVKLQAQSENTSMQVKTTLKHQQLTTNLHPTISKAIHRQSKPII